MRGIGEKRRLVAFDQMPEPGQSESSWNEKQCDDPVEPDHNHRREANWDGDQMQRTVYRMIVCAVVMRVKAHMNYVGQAARLSCRIKSSRPAPGFRRIIARN